MAMLTVRLTVEERWQLRQAAAREDKSMNQWARELLLKRAAEILPQQAAPEQPEDAAA